MKILLYVAISLDSSVFSVNSGLVSAMALYGLVEHLQKQVFCAPLCVRVSGEEHRTERGKETPESGLSNLPVSRYFVTAMPANVPYSSNQFLIPVKNIGKLNAEQKV